MDACCCFLRWLLRLISLSKCCVVVPFFITWHSSVMKIRHLCKPASFSWFSCINSLSWWWWRGPKRNTLVLHACKGSAQAELAQTEDSSINCLTKREAHTFTRFVCLTSVRAWASKWLDKWRWRGEEARLETTDLIMIVRNEVNIWKARQRALDLAWLGSTWLAISLESPSLA